MVLPVVLPLIIKDFSLSYAQAGLLVSGLYVSFALFNFPAGYAADKLSKKMLITSGLILFSIGMLLTGFAKDYWQILVFQIFAGCGGGLYHPSGLPMVSNIFVKKRGRAMGIHGAGGMAGTFIGPLVAGLVGSFLSWKWSFFILSIPGFLISFLSWSLIKETKELRNIDFKEKKVRAPSDVVRVFNGGELVFSITVLSMVYALFMFSVNGLTAFVQTYLVDEYRLSIAYASLMTAIIGGISIISQSVSGWLSDYLGRKKVISLNMGLTALLISIFALSKSTLLLPIILIFMGLLLSSPGPVIFAYVADVTPSATWGKSYGIFYSMGGIIGSTSPIVLGYLGDLIGLRMAFLFLAISAGVGAILILFMRKSAQNFPVSSIKHT